ncbi:MAG TPA: hypothetical protein VHS78_10210 [Candidatus Elarobacter sp.]|jgi:hypothetical protein|nr:hypothetical protein [Candidatus Elarobacter sp.]
MTLTILVLVVLVALAGAFVMLTRRDAAAVPAARNDGLGDEEEGIVSEPVPVNGTAHVAEPDRITWTRQFDPHSGPLDDAARLRLIEDLGMLRASWCVPLLEQACREETDPAHREAAQRALASCGGQPR